MLQATRAIGYTGFRLHVLQATSATGYTCRRLQVLEATTAPASVELLDANSRGCEARLSLKTCDKSFTTNHAKTQCMDDYVSLVCRIE